MLHWENSEPFLTAAIAAATTGTASSSFERTNRWELCTMWNSPSTPRDKPAQPLGRQITPN
jgi:hypothetical protein